MKIVLGIIAVVLAIILLIVVHEFGHYIIARLFKIKIVRFVIGLGKPLFKFTSKKNIVYQLSVVPLGGYVKMLDEREAPVPSEMLSNAFNRQAIWKRILVILAGPLASFILAVLAFWLMFSVGLPSKSPIVGQVLQNSPAAVVEIQPQDEIIAVDDNRTNNWMKVAMNVITRVGEEGELKITVKVHDSETVLDKFINLKFWKAKEKLEPLNALGIVPLENGEERIEQYSVGKSFIRAWQEVIVFSQFNFTVLKKLITGKISIKSLAGPLTLFKGAFLSWQKGFAVFLNFLAVLSLAVAIANSLPIPGLDGGHLLYFAIEAIRKKPVSIAVQVLALRLSIILFSVLLIVLLINELMSGLNM